MIEYKSRASIKPGHIKIGIEFTDSSYLVAFNFPMLLWQVKSTGFSSVPEWKNSRRSEKR